MRNDGKIGMSQGRKAWDTAYEWRAVALLAFGFGLVGLDRFMILPMYPTIAKDLHLSYSDLGQVTGALSIGWAISAAIVGRLSDLMGRRRVVLAAICSFSLLVGISGLATGLFSLLLIRALMGLADGAYSPPSIVATIEASKPSRRGLNVGIQQMMLPLFGLALAPLIVTPVLELVGWRWAFVFITPIGLITALLLYRVLREPDHVTVATQKPSKHRHPHKWSDVLKYRNIIHNMVGMLCWMTCVTVTGALMPNYLVDYRLLSGSEMGFVMSAIGFGSTIGAIALPWLSDKVGRKPVMLLCTVGGFCGLIGFMLAGADTNSLFATLLVTNIFVFPLITLTIGALSAESVPPMLMASASGTVIFTGEVFGGGIAPVVAGAVAEEFGIRYIVPMGAAALVAGFINSCFLTETAPARTGGMARPCSHPDVRNVSRSSPTHD